jgi:hypothetical protein
MVYRIKIRGKLDKGWSDWLYGARIVSKFEQDSTVITTLTVVVVDQSALFGVLDRVRDMNLLPISVERIDDEK